MRHTRLIPKKEGPGSIHPRPFHLMKSQIAYHEAGHAVIARVVGIELERVLITDSGGVAYLGQIDDAESDVLLTFAGPAAELYYCPCDGAGWAGDKEDAAAALIILCDYEPSLPAYYQLWDQLECHSRNLVEANWAAIERVAEALIAHGELNQDEVDNLIFGESPA